MTKALEEPSAIRHPPSAIKVLIAGGGTGGHVYVGIALAQELMRRNPGNQVLFVGTAKGMETKLVPRAGFELKLIEVTALKRVGLLKTISSLLQLPKSFLAARSLIREFKPEVVIGVGGYASGPVGLMAALSGVPTIVAEQNALPGFTNRRLAPFVRAAAVSFEEARRFFGKKAELTGNPVRAEFLNVPTKPPGAIVHLLVTGGSQGARSLNEAMIGAIEFLEPVLRKEGGRFAIVHQTGESDFEKVSSAYARLSVEGPVKAEAKRFIEKMADEFVQADLVISRAGATTVAELAAAGKPSLLVPFPFAADDHQRKNAEAIERAGAGRMLLQEDLTPERLAQELLWLARDAQQLQGMSAASRKLARPDAAKRIVDMAERVRNSVTG